MSGTAHGSSFGILKRGHVLIVAVVIIFTNSLRMHSTVTTIGPHALKKYTAGLQSGPPRLPEVSPDIQPRCSTSVKTVVL